MARDECSIDDKPLQDRLGIADVDDGCVITLDGHHVGPRMSGRDEAFPIYAWLRSVVLDSATSNSVRLLNALAECRGAA